MDYFNSQHTQDAAEFFFLTQICQGIDTVFFLFLSRLLHWDIKRQPVYVEVGQAEEQEALIENEESTTDKDEDLVTDLNPEGPSIQEGMYDIEVSIITKTLR